MATPLLKVDNLSIRFPTAEPVRNLSFSANEKETLAIVGEVRFRKVAYCAGFNALVAALGQALRSSSLCWP